MIITSHNNYTILINTNMFTKTYLKQRNDLMDRFAPIGLNNLASEILSNVESFFLPLTDVTETKDAYEIHVALPGFKREEIAVNMEDQILTCVVNFSIQLF